MIFLATCYILQATFFIILILAIETSCDETAISIIKTNNKLPTKGQVFLPPNFEILSSVVSSQTKIHAHWGGVVPNLARREHEKNLILILEKALKKAGLLNNSKIKNQKSKLQFKIQNEIQKILNRETELSKQFLEIIPAIKIPPIDAIAVTIGPGLEPALWVGLNFAKALAVAWNKPIIPVNHLEGHVFSVLLGENRKSTKHEARNSKQTINQKYKNSKQIDFGFRASDFEFPAVCLLVSGGHTELILMRDWLKYETIGQTRDDAVGEAFDKVARILGLPYPGGPTVAKKAMEFLISNSKFLTKTQIQNSKTQTKKEGQNLKSLEKSDPGNCLEIGNWKLEISLPRPMLNSGDFDFSFSGLKTAVLYKIRDLQKDPNYPLLVTRYSLLPRICAEFQQASIDVLVSKTIKAAKKYNAKSVILCGGVSANKELRKQLRSAVKHLIPNTKYHIPSTKFSGDNAAMIAAAASFRVQKNPPISGIKNFSRLKADGNLGLK